jgi:uracil-DNA glycosylase family 4
MKVLFVGSNPSIKNTDPNVPFEGTKSQKILNIWINFLQLADYNVVNILDRVTTNNRPLTKREIKNCILDFKEKIKHIEYDRIIALGNSASVALKMLKLDHYKLPHPSGRNRLLNSKDFVNQTLNNCKIYIYEKN